MKQTILTTIAITLFIVLSLNVASALVVDADYITIFSGEQGVVSIEVENNENFDIEDISFALLLSTIGLDNQPTSLPFTAIGSSEKDVEDLDENDEDNISFRLKASTDIIPGDYNIPYLIKYKNAEEDNDPLTKSGTFGIRISAKTELDFGVETKNPIVGREGKLSLEIINKGLGDIKAVSVQVFPQGYELLSKDKIFVGTINADDSDIISFEVIFKSTNPSLNAKIDYKDFDNNDKTKTVNLPVTIYTKEKALELGLIKQSRTGLYTGVIVALIIIWIIWRKIKKARRNKNKINGGMR